MVIIILKNILAEDPFTENASRLVLMNLFEKYIWKIFFP